MADRAWSAKTLVVLSIAGACLVSATWFLAFVPVPSFPVADHGFWSLLRSERLRLAGYLVPGALGLSLSFWAGAKFRRGVQDDWWSEAELDTVRGFLRSAGWRFAGWFLLLVCLCLLLLHAHSDAKVFVYLLVLPFVRAQSLREQITPKVRTHTGLADWRNFKRIRSEHWGGRA